MQKEKEKKKKKKKKEDLMKVVFNNLPYRCPLGRRWVAHLC